MKNSKLSRSGLAAPSDRRPRASGAIVSGLTRPLLLIMCLLSCGLLATGCSPSKYSVKYVMVPMLDNAREAAYMSDDLKTFRDAAAANLFLLDVTITDNVI